MINNSPPLLSTEIFEIKSDIKVLIGKMNQNNERINPILFFSKTIRLFLFLKEFGDGSWVIF